MASGTECQPGTGPDACRTLHLVPRLDPTKRGKFRCPAHPDSHLKFSISVGTKGRRIVWRCFNGCDPYELRVQLEKLGIDAACLGDWLADGPESESAESAVPRRLPDAVVTIADAGRWRAVAELPQRMNGSLLRLCIQAISEGDGALRGDPHKLIPFVREEFLALARRAGIERAYAYKLYVTWLKEAA